MDTYYTLKMKRKDLDDVYDEFSDFSLSSPARKIRRLDAELPPIIEEVEEPEIPIAFAQAATDPSFGNNGGNRGVVIEELPSVPENEERAIVLFKPMNTHLVHSPSNFSVKVDLQFINGFKSQAFWGNQANAFRPAHNGATPEEDPGSTKECLAVVPWVPSQLPSAQGAQVLGQADTSDMMDAEEMEGVMMDVEDSSVNAEPRTVVEAGAVSLNEGLHPWQQQHCMTTQLPQNTSTPIVWYR
ncbi:uncharacterized protein LOC107793335 [Nicotiana tabacum]|uniref:Uncharacterized protein LOC107793335 n=2 Tax=Nicotiana TaxID=4085 RepID=A0A1S4A3I3_TOBAC|nr:PREDICTED: uncharacterized protein LOC104246372 [Nicotiana sylvestris]XP_016471144.1 PREDICTED: uncharacterized protein LOC107793335 [Nicotiana tabacum]